MRQTSRGRLAAAALFVAALVTLTNTGDPFREIAPGPALTVLEKRSGIGVSASDGRRLYDLVLARRAVRALEVGTGSGYSAVWIAAALRQTGGRLTTIEIDPARAEIAEEKFRVAGVAGLIDLHVNDALLELPNLEGPFDFVFLDPGVPLNRRAFELLGAKLAPRAAIVCHNGVTLYFQQRDYLDALGAGGRFSTRLIPTLSGGLHVAEGTAAR